MKSRRVLKASLVVLVVLFASLTTARAHQIWTENGAKSVLDSARATAHTALRHASKVGLTAVEMAPYVARSREIASRHAPASATFWGSERANFFSAQTRAYRKLSSDLRREVKSVTIATHRDASARATTLRTQIAKGKSLDVETGAAASTLAAQQSALARSTTPGQNRAVAATVSRTEGTLDAAIRERQTYVNVQLAAAGGSVAAVIQAVDNQVAGAHAQLDLISLLSNHAKAERTMLDGLAATAHAQRSAYAAAVKGYAVHAEIAKINTDYLKTVPSKLIVVSTENQSAQMFENGKVVYSTPVTTGGPELPTDIGIFHIYMKASPFEFHSPWPPGSPYYYPPTPVTYWMPFDGAEGLHDASWRGNFGPGSNLQPTDLGTGNYILGTHGCVNLPFDAAQFVWDWAPIGTTVVVT